MSTTQASYRDDLFESFIAADRFLTHMHAPHRCAAPALLPRYREALFNSEVIENPEMLARWNAWCAAVTVETPTPTRYLADSLGLPADWSADRYSTTIELSGPRGLKAMLVLPYGEIDLEKLKAESAAAIAKATGGQSS